MLATEKGFRRDEKVHSKMIKRIYSDKIQSQADFENLTNIPGYHYAVAYVARGVQVIAHPFGKYPKQRHIRYISATVFGTLLVLGVYVLVRTTGRAEEEMFTVLTLPLVFLFTFVVYTDIPAIALFLLAVALAYKRHHWVAAGLFALTLLVRQDMVIYIAATVVAFMLADIYERVRIPTQRRHWIALLQRVGSLQFLLRYLPYGLVMSAFAGFVVINGGVALGDKSAHPAGALHWGNIYFFLLCFAVLFLPLVVASVPDIVRNISRLSRMQKVGLVLLILAGWFFYDKTFVIDHAYNFVTAERFLHNDVLIAIATVPLARGVSYAIILAALGALFTLQWRNTALVLLWTGATVTSLALHWLIEPRYSLPGLLAVIALAHIPQKLLRIQILYSVVLCIIVYSVFIMHDAIFL